MWTVYIIETERGTLYTGVTTDIDRRWKCHVQGTGAKYLRANKPRRIVYREAVLNKSAALKREAAIKKLSRKRKLALFCG